MERFDLATAVKYNFDKADGAGFGREEGSTSEMFSANYDEFSSVQLCSPPNDTSQFNLDIDQVNLKLNNISVRENNQNNSFNRNARPHYVNNTNNNCIGNFQDNPLYDY